MKYNCPVCNGELRESVGTCLHPHDPKYGITLDCPSLTCPAQEVVGHGDNVRHAFEIVTQKFNRRK